MKLLVLPISDPRSLEACKHALLYTECKHAHTYECKWYGKGIPLHAWPNTCTATAPGQDAGCDLLVAVRVLRETPWVMGTLTAVVVRPDVAMRCSKSPTEILGHDFGEII
eukprot:scaffold10354_cov18-Tisochrysis_lutea.AAC.1